MRKVVGALAGLGLILAIPAASCVEAQRPFTLGAQVSWADKDDLGIGIRYENRLNTLAPNLDNLRAVASLDFFPGNNDDYVELNANVAYSFTMQGSSLLPYAGGGLNFSRRSNGTSSTDLRLNILGGTQFQSYGRLRPYVEARLEFGGGEQLVLTGGFLF